MTRKLILSLTALCVAFSAFAAGKEMPALKVTSALPGSSIASWRAGDKLMVYHCGTVYSYVTGQDGDAALFLPAKGGQKTYSYDPSQPLNVYYNVDAVNGRGEALFSVSKEQRQGEISGRLPQWGRVDISSPDRNDKEALPVQMSPLVTVIEIIASAAEPFHIDRVVLLPLNSATGVTAGSGAHINPATGKITLPRQAGRPTSIGIAAGGADLSTHPSLYIMVAGANPGNQGFVADFFKGRTNNMRAVLLAGKDAGKDSGPSYMKIDLGEKKVGIASSEEFADFASGLSRGDKLALKYCDENGVVNLKADIDLSSIAGEGKDWEGVKDLRADFDGKGHSIYGYRISREGSAAIIASTGANVRNIIFGNPGDYLEVTGGGWALAAPIAMTTNPNTVVEGCVNRSEVRSLDGCTGGVFVGGIVGRAASSITGCANIGKITMGSATSNGVKYAGGIVACLAGDMGTVRNTIASCSNRAEIFCATSEKAWIGGIVGRVPEVARAWAIEKCTNKGKVVISSLIERVGVMSFIGGIAGELALPVSCHGATHLVKGCRNTGTIASNADGRISMGGIAGCAKATVFDACINTAEVAHSRGLDSDASIERNFVNMGGITGMLMLGSTVVSCENAATGAISTNYSSAHRIGGIVGASGKSTVKQCTNSAPVFLKLSRKAKVLCAAGGICGIQDGDVTDLIYGCTNNGEVTLTVNVIGRNAAGGGILGVLAKGGVSSCKNKGNVTAINELALPDMYCVAGGIAGRVYSTDVQDVADCTNTGRISADAPYSPSKGVVAAGETTGDYD